MRKRIGGIWFAALCGFGMFFGFALYTEAYGALPAKLDDALFVSNTLPIGTVLLYAAMPAFAYIGCMLFCALETRALALWGICPLFSGVRYGMSTALMIDAGIPFAAILLLPLLAGQAVMALISLDCRHSQTDAYALIERFLVPATAYLTAVSVIQWLFCVWMRRALLY